MRHCAPSRHSPGATQPPRLIQAVRYYVHICLYLFTSQTSQKLGGQAAGFFLREKCWVSLWALVAFFSAVENEQNYTCVYAKWLEFRDYYYWEGLKKRKHMVSSRSDDFYGRISSYVMVFFFFLDLNLHFTDDLIYCGKSFIRWFIILYSVIFVKSWSVLAYWNLLYIPVMIYIHDLTL